MHIIQNAFIMRRGYGKCLRHKSLCYFNPDHVFLKVVLITGRLIVRAADTVKHVHRHRLTNQIWEFILMCHRNPIDCSFISLFDRITQNRLCTSWHTTDLSIMVEKVGKFSFSDSSPSQKRKSIFILRVFSQTVTHHIARLNTILNFFFLFAQL